MISTLPSIAEASAAIRDDQLTPFELVEFCLKRIERDEPRVHAWVIVDEAGARREAERLREMARRSQWLGPLHGIPVGIKDIIDVAGWPTKCGSPLRNHRIAASDAEVVARLRHAGAIILGKTVTTEFASFDPPPTRNPWHSERTPGGSSSGSAAAVALEMCMAALGTQTGGSIVRPASYCGVVGFKPSYGAIRLDGIEPLAWNLDHAGPITRNVDDAALLFQVLRNQSERENVDGEQLPWVQLAGFFQDRADEQVRKRFHDALQQLADAGLTIAHRVEPPLNFEELYASHRCLMAVEAATHHHSAFVATPEKFGPRIRSLLTEGEQVSAVTYSAALRHQFQIQQQLASGTFREIWVMPSTTSAAPTADSTGDPAFNSVWSFTGLPEITIPCGWTDDGLPCGIQFVGPPGEDLQVLKAAALCERVLGTGRRKQL